MKINIAISSNRRFLNNTYSPIVNGFLESGIDAEDIYIFNGNDNTPENKEIEDHKNQLGINLINLNYNCFELNSMLGILEHKLDNCDYWFICHDTCQILKEFKEKLYNYDYKNFSCVRCGRGNGTGSIGSYRYSCLEESKKDFYKVKNAFDEGASQNDIKSMCVSLEDRIFLLDPNSSSYGGASGIPTGKRHKEGRKSFKTKNSRIATYYNGIGVIKYKANWKPKKIWEINDL